MQIVKPVSSTRGTYRLFKLVDNALDLCNFRVGNTSDISQFVADGFNREINLGFNSLASPLLYVGCMVTNGQLPIKEGSTNTRSRIPIIWAWSGLGFRKA